MHDDYSKYIEDSIDDDDIYLQFVESLEENDQYGTTRIIEIIDTKFRI